MWNSWPLFEAITLRERLWPCFTFGQKLILKTYWLYKSSCLFYFYFTNIFFLQQFVDNLWALTPPTGCLEARLTAATMTADCSASTCLDWWSAPVLKRQNHICSIRSFSVCMIIRLGKFFEYEGLCKGVLVWVIIKLYGSSRCQMGTYAYCISSCCLLKKPSDSKIFSN